MVQPNDNLGMEFLILGDLHSVVRQNSIHSPLNGAAFALRS